MTVTRVWLEPRVILTATIRSGFSGFFLEGLGAQGPNGEFAWHNWSGGIVKVRACGPESAGANLRAMQKRVAASLGENAAHIVVEAPELERDEVPAGTPEAKGWRQVGPEEAVERWLAEYPPKGVDPERVRAAMLEAVKIGGRDGR